MGLSFSYIKKALVIGSPVVISQLGFVLMGSTDTIMVGKISTVCQAACGLGNSLFFLVMIIGFGVLYGITSLVSIDDGAKELRQSWRYIKIGRLLLIPITIILGAFIFLMTSNFSIFQQPDTVNKLAIDYLNIINISTPFLLLSTLYGSFLNGLGKTIPNMVITFICLVLNYFLNKWFIFGYYFIPSYGFIGSAYATVIARFMMCLLTILYCYNNSIVLSIRKRYKKATSFIVTSKEILTIGLPIGAQLFLEVFAFTASYIIAGWLGDLALSAHQVILNIASITFMFITGISTAANIMIGNGFGAKDKAHIMSSALACGFLVIFFELIFCLVLILFRKPLVELYSVDKELLALAVPLMIIAAAFQLFDGLQNLALNMLRGVKDVKVPAMIAFVSYWLIMVPLGYYLAVPKFGNLGLSGIWWGFVFGLGIASIVLNLRFFLHLRTLKWK